MSSSLSSGSAPETLDEIAVPVGAPTLDHRDGGWVTPLPWFSEGLGFTCTQCGNCCTGSPGAVWFTEEELESIAAALGRPVDEVRQTDTHLVQGKPSLRELSNGDCVYLDPTTRGCTVYAARPAQCRTWPFWRQNLVTPERWEAVCQVCPGAGRGAQHSSEAVLDVMARSPL